MRIVKRNGTEEPYDGTKIFDIIVNVLRDIGNTTANPNDVYAEVISLQGSARLIPTEKLNDYVEAAFMKLELHEAFRSFVLHREKNKNIRKMSADNSARSGTFLYTASSLESSRVIQSTIPFALAIFIASAIRVCFFAFSRIVIMSFAFTW